MNCFPRKPPTPPPPTQVVQSSEFSGTPASNQHPAPPDASALAWSCNFGRRGGALAGTSAAAWLRMKAGWILGVFAWTSDRPPPQPAPVISATQTFAAAATESRWQLNRRGSRFQGNPGDELATVAAQPAVGIATATPTPTTTTVHQTPPGLVWWV